MEAMEVSKERLQDLGRRAALLHSNNRETLTDAVTLVLEKEAGLAPEHVKRVVEFANNEAYRSRFNSMDGEHRIVNLDGGPASPGEVLRELEMSDSAPALVKSAARVVHDYIPGEELVDIFDKEKIASGVDCLPKSRPHGELIDLRYQLQAVQSDLMQKVSSAASQYEEAASKMYSLVKKAVLSGVSPAEISTIYQRVSPSPVLTKLALRDIADRMEPECVPAVTVSSGKIKEASEKPLNVQNPLVSSFLEFAKVAEARVAIVNNLSDVDAQLKRVNKALYEAMK